MTHRRAEGPARRERRAPSRPRSTLALPVALLIGALLIAGPLASADPWTDARVLALERNTLGLRADHPDRGELARLRRELRSLQVRPSDRDAEIDRLERRLLDLERQTDRVEARRQLDRSLELEGDTLQLAVPEAYRPPWPEDIRGQDRLIGVGKLVVRVQRSLRAGARELEVGRRSAATRHLADAERSLARLEPGFAVDPTTIALRAEAARLRARLTD